jgi:hypothetical protein
MILISLSELNLTIHKSTTSSGKEEESVTMCLAFWMNEAITDLPEATKYPFLSIFIKAV